MMLRDEAHRRVRVLTALAGAGSVAGTGGILVAVAGSGVAAAPVAAAAVAPAPVVTHHRAHPPASLLATKKVHHRRVRSHALPRTAPVAARRTVAPVPVVKPVTRHAPAAAPTSSAPTPAPQPTDAGSSGGGSSGGSSSGGSGGCCSHSGGSH